MSELDDLRALKPRIRVACVKLLENLPGYGNGSDGPSSGHGDRTVTLAMKATMATDPAVRDLAVLDRLAPGDSVAVLEAAALAGHRITRPLNELHPIINRWAPTPRMLDGLRTETLGRGDDGCVSCRRVKLDDGRRGWGEVHARDLCKFCIRAIARTAGLYEWDGDLPPLGVVEWHHRAGKYLTDEVIHRVMHGKKRRA